MVRENVTAVLARERPRGSVPSLVVFREGRFVRRTLIDLPGSNLEDAWAIWRRDSEDPSSPAFLRTVFDILSHDVPRLYRDITVVRLDDAPDPCPMEDADAPS